MQQFLKFLVSRAVLAFVALVVVSLAVWFVGPLLSFGDLRPLASVGVRIAVLLLLVALLLFWIAQWSLSVVGVVAACVLVWYAGAPIAVGELRPLAEVWTRVLLIGLIVFVYASYNLYTLWNAMRTDDKLLKKIFRTETAGPAQVGKEEVRHLKLVFSRAMQQLRQMRSSSTGIRRLFEGRRYIYELPWYMLVGAPGAGKSTAIVNSGLKFPLASQLSAAAVKNQGGTDKCDWWFTNEAVLIDTAGRYTEHADQPGEAEALSVIEWKGVLGLLRKYRPRAPINGVLVVVSVSDLLSMSDEEAQSHAASVRARLVELRTQLGIRFPVYVVVTKMDLIQGFGEYFQSLTTEGRGQVWGFTLPTSASSAKTSAEAPSALTARELGHLAQRLQDGITARLHEEYQLDRRRKLYVLPQEFASLSGHVATFVERVFLESRFDDTEKRPMLRGVYFTSAAQAHASAVADRLNIFQRFRRYLSGIDGLPRSLSAGAGIAKAQEHRSFFLHDLLHKVIFREAHLVRPNLRWEWRFRLARIIGHALAIVVFGWLAGALIISFGNNRDYLAAIGQKSTSLAERVNRIYKERRPEGVPGVLDDARDVASFPGLDPQAPADRFRYGLYSAPPILQAADETYASLQRHTMLPYLVRRMEAVLSGSIASKDEKRTYETLRAYLMLYEPEKFDAGEVRVWVLRDWESSDSAGVFGGRAAMVEHVGALFAGDRVVSSPLRMNDSLVQSARALLNTSATTDRLYERAKAAMAPDSPDDFTLVRAVGPQAGTVFARASGEPLDEGVPGLFTYQGYHELFNKRLPEFVAIAQADDAWVMGKDVQSTGRSTARQAAERIGGEAGRMAARLGSSAAGGSSAALDSPVANAIRRQYLSEYADRWSAYLDDLRAVSAGGGESGLGFELQVLRNLSAPDSPLARLARAAVKETTLSRTVPATEKSVVDRAVEKIDRTAREATRALGVRAEERMEKQLVENRFAALREVVTGEPDAAVAAGAAAGGKARIESILGLVNEYYTSLVVADAALAGNNLPPAADPAAKMRLESARLPAPFKQVLADLAVQGSRKVNIAVGELLIRQMEASIGDICRSAIEGKYPFAASAQEVNADDFARVFATGGLLDEFFSKTLAPHVDTGVRPWRYRLASPDTPPVRGPNLEAFQRAVAIREVFFREPGARKLAWKMDLKVMELDPSITDLIIDIDGQSQRYVHGPVTPLSVSWPGPRGGTMAELTANPRIRPDTSSILVNGPWALFRMLEKARLISGTTSSRTAAEYLFDGRKLVLDLSTGTVPNPLTTDLLRAFRCPGRSA